MNEELALVLGLVLAVITIVLAYTFISQGTDATLGSMNFVEQHTNRDVQNHHSEGLEKRRVSEVPSWRKGSRYLQA